MTDELQAAKALENIAPTLWEYIILGFMTIMAYFVKNRDERITTNEKEINNLDKALRDHRYETAKEYVTKGDFDRTVAKMEDTTKRIYERIDQIFDKLNKA